MTRKYDGEALKKGIVYFSLCNSRGLVLGVFGDECNLAERLHSAHPALSDVDTLFVR